MIERRAAVDLDGTLAHTLEAWIKYFEIPIKKEDVTEWTFSNIPLVTPDLFIVQTDWLWEHKYELIEYDKSIDQATENPKVRFDIITKRTWTPGILNWLRSHSISHTKLHCVSCPKVLLPYRMYIDDDPSLAVSIQRYNRVFPNPKILMLTDQPYNTRVQQKEHVYRVKNIDEAFLKLETMGYL